MKQNKTELALLIDNDKGIAETSDIGFLVHLRAMPKEDTNHLIRQ